MTIRKPALLVVFPLLLCLLGGCSKDKDAKKARAAELGEPVGAEVPASGTVPAFSLALAVSKGQDPVAFLPKVVGLVSSSVKACPNFVKEQENEVTGFPFTLEGGKVHVTGLTDDSLGTKCMLSALDGKELAGGPQAGVLDGRIEVKLSAAPKP